MQYTFLIDNNTHILTLSCPFTFYCMLFTCHLILLNILTHKLLTKFANDTLSINVDSTPPGSDFTGSMLTTI